MTRRLILVAMLSVLLPAVPARSQDQPAGPDLFQPFGSLAGDPGSDEQLKVSASLHPANAMPGETVTLAIEVIIPEGYYTYPIGDEPNSTTLKFTDHAGLDSPSTKPRADHPPKVVVTKIGKTDFRQEKYIGRVVWRQAFKRAAGNASVNGTITLSMCNAQGCLPPEDFPIQVTLGEGPELAETDHDLHPFELDITPTLKTGGTDKPTPVSWHIQLSPSDAKPGETVTLALSATLQDGYHIFALSQDSSHGGLPTRFFIEGLRGLEDTGDGFVEDRAFETKSMKLATGTVEQKLFHDTVTWSRTYRVTQDADKAGYGTRGRVLYQYCDKIGCRKGRVAFSLGHVAAIDSVAKTGDDSAITKNGTPTAAPASLGTLLSQVGIAMIAGFILNFMPCVLPVIGLKIMSFVSQAGENRRRAFLLNLAFSAGLMSVFAVLATLVGVVGAGWGSQFTSAPFNIIMAVVVFVFALSFLGVWEIPVPGFGSTHDSSQQEGLTAAFAKGVLTTILATPCTGPLLVPAMSWAVSQSIPVTYLVLLSVGLGMALPYLLIGAFPKLISFLPKPGMWMETFKQVMGFVLLGTVIYPMFVLSGIDPDIVVPTLLFLFSLWAAFWWIGRVPLTQPRWNRIKSWAQAVAFSSLMGVVSFNLFYQPDDGFWTPYSDEILASHLEDNHTVLIDFTADW
jgi:cytochrome c biogenesis protein CcdA